MKRRILQQKNCFAIGIAGAVCSLAAGILMALAAGPAYFLRNAAMALTGGMLLFLATTEKGEDKRVRRTKLLLLFMAWLVSFFDLPLLCPPLEAIVLPLLGLMYREKGSRADLVAIITLGVLEAGYVVVRTLGITDVFGLPPGPMRAVGLALGVVALARGWLLVRLYLGAAKQPRVQNDNEVHQLR